MSYSIGCVPTLAEGATVAIVDRVNVDGNGHHYVRFLETFVPAVSYAEIAARLAALMQQDDALRFTTVLVDGTEIGSSAHKAFVATGVPARDVRIGGTGEATHDLVSRADLVGTLLTLAQERRLHVADALPLARAFTRDLAALRDPRELPLLVRAVALACYVVERRDASFEADMATLDMMSGTRAFSPAPAVAAAASARAQGRGVIDVVPGYVAPEFASQWRLPWRR